MKKVVIKHNQIIKASYKLTPLEQAIVLNAITKVDENITDQKIYEINQDEIIKFTGGNKSNLSRDIKKACDLLLDRKIILIHEYEEKFPWTQLSRLDKSTGKVFIRFSHDIIPYLSNLKDNFTMYNISHVAKFKSHYGVRVYELLRQWINTKKTLEITVADIKEMFQLGKTYDHMSNLKKRVLDPAVKDINTYSDLSVTYENIKSGRTIVGFVFRFQHKELTKHDLSSSYIEQNALPGESWDQAKIRLLSNLE